MRTEEGSEIGTIYREKCEIERVGEVEKERRRQRDGEREGFKSKFRCRVFDKYVEVEWYTRERRREREGLRQEDKRKIMGDEKERGYEGR